MSRADKPINPVNPEGQAMTCAGMTLLEHYAGLAMQGLLSKDFGVVKDEEFIPWLASASVTTARALIAELEKEAK